MLFYYSYFYSLLFKLPINFAQEASYIIFTHRHFDTDACCPQGPKRHIAGKKNGKHFWKNDQQL